MIPKIIHQIWLGDHSKTPYENMKTVKDKNKNWIYYLWNEKNIGELINQNKYDEIYRYNKKSENKFRKLADIVRYEKLLKYGGVYIDADTVCLKPFDDLLDNEFFVAYENEKLKPGLIANGVIGSIPNHSILGHCVRAIGKINKTKLCKVADFKITGPVLLTKIINNNKNYNITVYPSWMFYPAHYSGFKHDLTKISNSYTHQLWQSTNTKKSSRLSTFFSSFLNYCFR